jgi:hypothetical protein
VLCLLLVVAWSYTNLPRDLIGLGGAPMADGAVGVVLGLYVCSHPAANAIDAFYAARRGVGEITWSGAIWLLLNAAVLVAGWLAIVAGAMRLVG